MPEPDHSTPVLLIHGLGGSRLDMWPVARRLRRTGFAPVNWGYRSFGNAIETHAAALSRTIDVRLAGAERFHVVAFSMEAVILRTMLRDRHWDALDRVVLLAPPNRGSHAARRLNHWIGWMSPSLEQLSDQPDSFVNQLPNSLRQRNLDFGIIEATRDRVIAPGAVRLDGLADFARVDGHHGILPWYPQTIELVEKFLVSGSFQPAVANTDEAPSTRGDRLAVAARVPAGATTHQRIES